MAGFKRKSTDDQIKPVPKSFKKLKPTRSESKPFPTGRVPNGVAPSSKRKSKKPDDYDELEESGESGGVALPLGFSAKDASNEEPAGEDSTSVSEPPHPTLAQKKKDGEKSNRKKENPVLDEHGHLKSTSREAHAQQKAVTKQRKAAKPNSDSVQRSKELWERLRLKSHVSKKERKVLVDELFGIITGRVKEFVFKHDATRAVQCALKYANPERRMQIAQELQGEFIGLAQSKYAKHMVAKLVVEGNKEIKAMIIQEFRGHVRKLINHPEASWIVDDIYRGVATKEQKAMLLREWYGPEFAIFQSKDANATAILSEILSESPEKRKPIMDHLWKMIDQLIQKKLFGFTMLHDAMLQYYLNCKPGSEEASEFVERLKGEGDKEDTEYDLLKNLAFTASGSRVVCTALATGSAKDRRHFLKVFKDSVETLEHDKHGHKVLLTALEVIDDTVGTIKAIFPEFAAKEMSPKFQEAIVGLAKSMGARIILLCAFALETAGSSIPMWLFPAGDIELLKDIYELRSTTSKKNPSVRRKEIVRALSPALLATVASKAAALSQTAMGIQFIIEVLLAADGDRSAAMDAVADLAGGDPSSEGHVGQDLSVGRMLKTLVLGGHFDVTTKSLHKVQESDFCQRLYERIKDHVVAWATGPGVWVVLALVQAEQEGWHGRGELIKSLQKRKEKLAKVVKKADEATKNEETGDGKKPKANFIAAGLGLLLEKLE